MSIARQIVSKPSKLEQQRALLGGAKPNPVKPEEPISAGEYQSIELANIRLDPTAQPREALNTERTAEYAAAMKGGDRFPSLVVFFDGKTYWLADGFHRHYAAQQAGIKALSCRVLPGGLRDAILFSVGANATHGLSRSDADKERAVLRLLNDDEWSTWTDREMAKRCRVSHPFVAKIRKEHASHTGSVSSMERTFVHPKTGKPTTMKTAGINASRKNAQRPSTNDEPSPEAGPQAEASLAGTGAAMPADREGRREGEATSVDLPTIPNGYDALVEAWTAATPEDRDAFIAYLRVCGVIPSEQRENVPSQHEVRPGSTSLGIEQQCETLGVTAGETATLSHSPEPTSSPVTANKPGAAADAPGTPSKADMIRHIRPFCRHADDLSKCGGSGSKHCRDCEPQVAA